VRQQAQSAWRITALEEVEPFVGACCLAIAWTEHSSVGQRGGLDGWAGQEVAGAVVGFQKCLDTRTYGAVGTGYIQESLPLGGIFLEGLKKDLFYAGSR
jgi:hypothetical protein